MPPVQRHDFDIPTRMTLVEDDVEELKGLVRRVGWALFGLLISTTTSALLLAVNVKMMAGK